MGKYIAGILGAAALAWIAYVGINIASSGNAVNPNSVFPARNPVVIAHRPFNYNLVSATGMLPSNDLIRSLFENPERVQHMYFAAGGNTILLERSKPWTIELVKRFLLKNGLSGELTAARSLRVSNGWYARFDKEFLVLSMFEPTLNGDSNLDWNYLDRKSSYSILSWNKAYPAIENVYQKPDGSIVYVSTYNDLGKHLADDQDIFADAIPADLGVYTFYEKEYLRSLGDADPDFFTWTDAGAAVIDYNGNRCILTDFLPSQDPVAVLGDKVEEASLNAAKTSGHVTGSQLPQILLNSSSYYLEVFNNRVYIAEKKSTIDELIGVYESGKTLIQSPEKYSSLFAGSTRKVSFREISGTTHRTMSLLDGSRHTVLQQLQVGTSSEKRTKGTQPVRIEGGIEQVLPVQQSGFVYVLSKNGTLHGVEGNKVLWKLQFDQRLNGPLSFTGNNANDLLLVTPAAVHIISRNGSDRTLVGNGNEILGATVFSWRGTEQTAIVERNGITVIAGNGKKSTLAYSFENAPTQACAWVNNSDLRVSVLNGTKLVTFSIDRKRKVKETAVSGSDAVLVKSEQGPFVYTIHNETVQRTKWSGEQAQLGKAAQLTLADDRKNLLLISGSSVTVTDAAGNTKSHIQLPSSNGESAAYAESLSGRSAIAAMDGIANNNYVFGMNGKQLTAEMLEGSGITGLQYGSDGSLTLISQSNGYLVRYKIK